MAVTNPTAIPVPGPCLFPFVVAKRIGEELVMSQRSLRIETERGTYATH